MKPTFAEPIDPVSGRVFDVGDGSLGAVAGEGGADALGHQPDRPITEGRIDLLRHDIRPYNSKGCGIKPRALHRDRDFRSALDNNTGHDDAILLHPSRLWTMSGDVGALCPRTRHHRLRHASRSPAPVNENSAGILFLPWGSAGKAPAAPRLSSCSWVTKRPAVGQPGDDARHNGHCHTVRNGARSHR